LTAPPPRPPALLDELAAIPASVVDFVERLHAAVDEVTRPLEARLGPRLACARGCAGCCVDGLGVFAVEAAVLVRRHRALFEDERPGPPGACALLDEEGACRAYAARPYVCRTQGLPLRWVEEDDDGAPVELRDECGLCGAAGPPLEQLDAADCFALGPFEARLAAAQSKVDGGQGTRVALRSLFRHGAVADEHAAARLPVASSR
jgi:hypothetical protein